MYNTYGFTYVTIKTAKSARPSVYTIFCAVAAAAAASSYYYYFQRFFSLRFFPLLCFSLYYFSFFFILFSLIQQCNTCICGTWYHIFIYASAHFHRLRLITRTHTYTVCTYTWSPSTTHVRWPSLTHTYIISKYE